MIVLGETQIRRILKSHAAYHDEARTHLSLGEDAPLGRPVRRFGEIIALSILGGLHHRHHRIWFLVGADDIGRLLIAIFPCFNCA